MATLSNDKDISRAIPGLPWNFYLVGNYSTVCKAVFQCAWSMISLTMASDEALRMLLAIGQGRPSNCVFVSTLFSNEVL